MRDLHVVLAWVVVFANGTTGAWVLAANWVPALESRVMWLAVHAAHFTVAAQMSVGAYLVASTNVEVQEIHMFYGFLTLLAVGLIIGYRQLSQYKHLLYGLGGLFIMGLAIRAMTISALA